MQMNSTKSKCNVIHIIAKLEKGGAEKLIYLLCTLLKENNINSRILTLIEEGSFAKEFTQAGIPVDLINISALKPLDRIFKIHNYLHLHKPDVVHTHLFHGDAYGQIAAFLARVKKRVSTLHNMIEIKTKINFYILYFSYLCSTDLIMVSNSVKNFWSRSFIGCKKKMSVIYNSPGFPNTCNCPTRRLPDNSKIQLLCLGSIHPVKGHIYVIQSMRLLRNSPLSFHLSIYGRDRDGYSDYLQNKINEFGLNEYVQLRGETDNPQDIIKSHDILIMPSISEGFGMALVEAMSLGLPVIASKIPAHKEILENGKYGLLVDVHNESEVYSSVLSLAQNSDLYQHYSQLSKHRSSDFTEDKMVASYSKLYRE